MEYVIGCDIGSQGTKGVLLCLDGDLIGEASASYPIDYPHPLWAEQPVTRWTTALTNVVRELVHTTGIEADAVRGLACATQVDGVVPIAAGGHALRPAIIWMDRRASAQTEALRSPPAQDEIFECTGLNLDASHVAPKIRWIAENEPQIYERAAHFLLPGSFIAHELTGELAVDYSNASSTLLLDVRAKEWSRKMCDRFGVEVSRLAPIGAATTVLGTLRPALADEWGLSPKTRVLIGCGDEHAACVGAGVLSPGRVGDIAGTAEPVCIASDQLLFDPLRLVETHCHADENLWLVENPGFVSGGGYRWFREQLGGQHPYAHLDELASQVPVGSEGLIFLPCLMGAMTPTWNEKARGTWTGFTLAHTRAHFARSILEGSAYAVRDILDQFRAIGLPLNELRVMGGGAQSRLWNQIKADVTGLPVTVLRTSETTALGAALLALVGVGAYSTLSEASERIIRTADRVEPQAAAKSIYDEQYALYRQTYFALEPVFDRRARST